MLKEYCQSFFLVVRFVLNFLVALDAQFFSCLRQYLPGFFFLKGAAVSHLHEVDELFPISRERCVQRSEAFGDPVFLNNFPSLAA